MQASAVKGKVQVGEQGCIDLMRVQVNLGAGSQMRD
jgi:hypothetical protein